ncbi:MAG: terpene cyclase/mutase family protein [Verrucomicrobia bacterium]|nr:terpene cyclase/mutase family protein [Verrucomicrobiota bacterium]MCH8513228.1 terpene cyclase/mutase family protein [Kiritimatiellia bacterium]
MKDKKRIPALISVLCLAMAMLVPLAWGQRGAQGLQVGETLPPELDNMYRAGLSFLASTQTNSGNWTDNYGQQPGVVGLAVLAFLASGEDPNFGPYRVQIRRAAEYIVSQQDANTGYIGNSMYNHAFATLALAELYGHLREPDVGLPLRRAIDLILTSQAQNPNNAWRYSPTSKDADTTVSGGHMVALFAARNAGLEVPEEALEKGLQFFKNSMAPDGGIGYTGPTGGNSTRTAIASLNFSLMNDYSSDESKKTFEYIRRNQSESGSYFYYHMYYLAQALFQGDMAEWRAWNRKIIEVFRATQQSNGSWSGQRGTTFSTASALLTVALNYRLLPIYER